MIKFNKEEYLKLGNETVERRNTIENIADEVATYDFDNIFFVSSGGSLAILLPYEKIIKRLSKIPVYSEVAGELVLTDNQQLTSKSLVITSSKSGDTKETVAAIKFCKEKGAKIVSFVGKMDSELTLLSNFTIHNHSYEVEHSYINFNYFIFRLLHNKDEFSEYNRFATQMELLPRLMLEVKEQFDPRAKEIAKAHYRDDYQIWVGGGLLWGDVYLFSMCVLEEMQWIRTKSVTSAEFFHGTLELVDESVPVFLIKGEDETRPLDDRVERFINDFTERGVVIDTKDFELKGIDNEFRQYITPMIIENILTERLAVHFEQKTGHDLDFRRYYRQFDY